MKALVTGGAGFIGSHLVDRLLAEGHKVVVIDNFFMGKWENLQYNHPNILIYPTTIMGEIAGLYMDVDIVFHLAALTRPQVSILEPEESTRVNIEGTLNVIRHCLKKKVKKLVFVSSSSLYGEQEKLPTPEDAVPHPMSPYALTKLVGEQYCKLYEVLEGLKANYIRPFNVYGKRQNPAGGYAAAVPAFIEALSQDKPGNITGDGEQRRDFTYVDDVVDLIIKAGESEVSGEAFNAGAGNNHSIIELYQTISDVMGKNIPPKHIPAVVEPHMTLADTSKARRILGWEPKVSLEEGIRRMVWE
jgi:nucleoside-diphosphate-sugar epimerase